MISPKVVAILLGAVLLLFTSLLYQASRDYQERMFAKPVTLAVDGLEIRITYPEVIWREPPAEQRLPLTVELLSSIPVSPTSSALISPTSVATSTASLVTAVPAATAVTTSTATTTATASQPGASSTPTATVAAPLETISYMLVFSPADSLVFFDADAKPVPPRIRLSEAQPLDVIYLRPAPIITATASVTFEVRQEGSTIVSATPPAPLVIRLDDSRATWGRRISTRLLGDAGLPLGVAIAIVGWTLEADRRQREERQETERRQREERQEVERRQREERQEVERRQREERQEVERRQREEREKEQQALADSILDMMSSDPVPAIAKYHRLEEGFLPPKLDNQIREHIAFLNNREVRDEWLKKAGEYLSEENKTKFTEVVTAICDTFSNDRMAEHIKTISEFISKPSEKVFTAAEAAKWLYIGYYSSREICVGVMRKIFEFISKSPKKDELFNDIIGLFYRSDTKEYTAGWDMLLDERIISNMKSINSQSSGNRVGELSSLERSWFDRQVILTDRELFRPFNIYSLQWWKICKIDVESLSLEKIKKKLPLDDSELRDRSQLTDPTSHSGLQHTYIQCNDKLSSELVIAEIIAQASGSTPKLPAMPVEFNLPFATGEGGRTDLTTHFIAQAIGLRWLSITCTRPEWFFNLRPPEQQLVLRLLAWATGSYEACQVQMDKAPFTPSQQGFPRSDTDCKLILYKLRTLFEREGRPNPSAAELRSWLHLRPNNITATLLLAQFEPGEAVDADIKSLTRFARWLEQAHVYLVLCGTTQIPVGFHTIDLATEMELFKKTLNKIFATAAGTSDFSFEDLISRDLPEPKRQELVKRLIVNANGSLSTLLSNIARIVDHHVGRFKNSEREESNPKYRFLSPEDFDAVLSDPGTSP